MATRSENKLKLISASELITPTSKALTDLGNAERLIANHDEELRYCDPLGGWLFWDGSRWRRDESGQVYRWAIETARAIYTEASIEEEPEKRAKLAVWATRSESAQRLDAMVKLARNLAPATPDEFDADPWLLNVENGTLDLRTGELWEHNRGDMLTKLAPTKYDPEATAPTWATFLERVMPDAETRAFLQRAVGYSLTGSVGEEVLFVTYGTGRNGKSKFLGAIQDTLGRDYAQQMPPEAIMLKKGEGGPTSALARLKGVRFAATVETGEGGRLDEAVVKQATGGDTITARYLFREFFEFDPTHKIWLATNHKPTVRGTDEGIWSRIKLVPFEVMIPEAERDKNLDKKLAKERAGILVWAVQGCLAWQREGLGFPSAVRRATEEYRASMDWLGQFLDDRCDVGEEREENAMVLYNTYVEWAKENGEYVRSQSKFGAALTERGFGKRRATEGPDKGRTVRTGLRLSNGISAGYGW
jgi:putative DNA primase/helicase